MNKIIIVGKANGWELAPTEGEVWGTNDLVIKRQSFSKVFDIHDIRVPGKEHFNKSVEIEKTLCETFGIDFICGDNYPIKEIIDYFGIDYFSSTISYMLAYAIKENPDKIELYGVNMATDSEYKDQKGSAEFWIGLAIGRGIEVTIHGSESELLICSGDYGKRNLYGYDIKQSNERSRSYNGGVKWDTKKMLG